MRFSIKQRKIQSIIENQFPITIKWLFVNITLADPKIVLVDGSERLGLIFSTILVLANKLNYSHDIYVDGEIDYQKHVGELFLNTLK